MGTSLRGLQFCCFLNGGGYSQAAQDYICALARTNQYALHVSLFHRYKPTPSMSPARLRLMQGLIAAPANDELIQIFHCTPQLQRKMRRRTTTVGFATFETLHPPVEWIRTLNANDAVIVPSIFDQAVFRKAGVTAWMFYIPHCIDTSLYNPCAVPLYENTSGVFKFLYFGAWKRRKGWPQLLEAYWREFSLADKVSLTIKTDDAVQCEKDCRFLRQELGLLEKDVAPIFLETTIFDEQRLPRFLKSHDCLVFPTLGEGFGLPPLQCMALGVPVICTNHSGCQDYLSHETATLLEPEGLRVYQMLDRITQFRNQAWAYVPVAKIQASMRHVWSNVDEAKSKAVLASASVSRDFGYSATAARFKSLFSHFGMD